MWFLVCSEMSETHCVGDEDLTTLVEGDSGGDSGESEVDEATEGERGRLRVSIQATSLWRALALRIVGVKQEEEERKRKDRTFEAIEGRPV